MLQNSFDLIGHVDLFLSTTPHKLLVNINAGVIGDISHLGISPPFYWCQYGTR